MAECEILVKQMRSFVVRSSKHLLRLWRALESICSDVALAGGLGAHVKCCSLPAAAPSPPRLQTGFWQAMQPMQAPWLALQSG